MIYICNIRIVLYSVIFAREMISLRLLFSLASFASVLGLGLCDPAGYSVVGAPGGGLGTPDDTPLALGEESSLPADFNYAPFVAESDGLGATEVEVKETETYAEFDASFSDVKSAESLSLVGETKTQEAAPQGDEDLTPEEAAPEYEGDSSETSDLSTYEVLEEERETESLPNELKTVESVDDNESADGELKIVESGDDNEGADGEEGDYDTPRSVEEVTRRTEEMDSAGGDMSGFEYNDGYPAILSSPEDLKVMEAIDGLRGPLEGTMMNEEFGMKGAEGVPEMMEEPSFVKAVEGVPETMDGADTGSEDSEDSTGVPENDGALEDDMGVYGDMGAVYEPDRNLRGVA